MDGCTLERDFLGHLTLQEGAVFLANVEYLVNDSVLFSGPS